MIIIPTATDRRRIIRTYSVIAALGWVIFQFCGSLFLGPHIQLARTITITSGIGAGVGFVVSCLQWLTLNRYVQAGWWIPMTTASCMLGGMLGGALLYPAVGSLETIIASPLLSMLENLFANAMTGLIIAGCQWLVFRQWLDRTEREPTWLSWLAPIGLGTLLACIASVFAQVSSVALMELAFGEAGAWPLALVTTMLCSSVAGSLVFAFFTAWALRRVLPTPQDIRRSALPAPA
jgi:hypothetical protein